MRVVSFDIFDTILTRRHAAPSDLFWDLGAALKNSGLIAMPPEEFAIARKRAELCARAKAPGGEVKLEEIGNQLAIDLGWDDSARRRCLSEELQLESQSLYAIPEAMSALDHSRRNADRILFLSDMYLPPEFIEAILRREGAFRDGDQLYVSGYVRANKAAGTLYERIKAILPNEADWLSHTGDNPGADVRVALRHGIDAREFSAARLNRYEKLARGDGNSVEPWRSRLAGAMRRARLENPEKSADRRLIWDTASDVVGPLLFGFVHWCLSEAKSRGLKRLYFVARDGQIMHRMAQIIAQAWGYDIECRYLYGSRQAWHPAAIAQLEEADLDWVMAPTRNLTVKQVFERIGCEPGSFVERLKAAGFPQKTWNEKTGTEAREKLGRLLLTKEVREQVQATGECRRKSVIGYLVQEGLVDGTPSAIVDIGWHGNLQRSLNRLLRMSGAAFETLPTGFYFGLLSDRHDFTESPMIGYWNRLRDPPGGIRNENLALFEIFTSADHGSVIDYREKDGRIEPAFRGTGNNTALEWGLTALQGGILRFCSSWVEDGPGETLPLNAYQETTRQIYRKFYRQPTGEEARVWGTFRHSDQQAEDKYEYLVPDMSCWRMVGTLLFNRTHRPFWWFEGAIARGGFVLPLQLYIFLRAAKRRWIDKACVL